MRTLKKTDLLAENSRLSHALGLYEQYTTHAHRSEVTWTGKGNVKLGICGETRAHGGIVIELWRNEKRWSVIGVFYWEKYLADVRAYPARHDDSDAQDRRTCAERVSRQVADKQAEFYAPKVAAAVSNL